MTVRSLSRANESVIQPPMTPPKNLKQTHLHTRIVRDNPHSSSVTSFIDNTAHFKDLQIENRKPQSPSRPSPKVSKVWEVRDVCLPTSEPQRRSSPSSRPAAINKRIFSSTRPQEQTGSSKHVSRQSIAPSHSPLKSPAGSNYAASEKVFSSNLGSPVVSQTLTGQVSSSNTDAVTLSARKGSNLMSDDEAMREADEFNTTEDGVSMDEGPPASDDGMSSDSDEHPLDCLIPLQSTVKLSRVSNMVRTASSDSGMDASSEPGPSRNSPVSIPSTRRSSRLSSYSVSSEDPRLIAFDEEFVPRLSIAISRSTTPEDDNAVAVCSRTLGGFPAFRFESYRSDPTNFPKVYYASEIPSAIQDHMNRQSDEVRKLSDIREVYEAMILENTAEDERAAPPIEIQNDIDDQPTPPWEFWYSNKMWHGEDVPDPDLKNLKGCDCHGACNPKSKTCACALRQGEVVGENMIDFAYDKSGRLKFPGFPIFECNNKCWCGPECGNRVKFI